MLDSALLGKHKTDMEKRSSFGPIVSNEEKIFKHWQQRERIHKTYLIFCLSNKIRQKVKFLLSKKLWIEKIKFNFLSIFLIFNLSKEAQFLIFCLNFHLIFLWIPIDFCWAKT